MKEKSWQIIGCPEILLFFLMMFWLGNLNIKRKAEINT
jgi:hypothetical protein